MIDFWLIRHGETEENVAGICQGQKIGTLTEKGLNQAVVLGEALKSKHFDHFYSSDLKRTMDTMQQVTQHHKQAEIIKEPLLRERYLADWEGKPFPKNWQQLPLPVGAETSDDLIVRAQKYLELLKKNHPGERVVAMSHGGMLRAFWTVLHHLPSSEFARWETPKNTSISRFHIWPNGDINTLTLNNVDHLNNDNLHSNNRSNW